MQFEIETSQIDRGASLRWCSQYPREEEVLLPPMSNLEVVGEPKMILHAGKSVMVFKLQLNINLGIMKREEHVGRRKALHLSSVPSLFSDPPSLPLPLSFYLPPYLSPFLPPFFSLPHPLSLSLGATGVVLCECRRRCQAEAGSRAGEQRRHGDHAGSVQRV